MHTKKRTPPIDDCNKSLHWACAAALAPTDLHRGTAAMTARTDCTDLILIRRGAVLKH